MARKIKSGLELSWHATRKRWYRTFTALPELNFAADGTFIEPEGKPVYKRVEFGSGKSQADMKSYHDALAKYHDHLAGREQIERMIRLARVANRVVKPLPTDAEMHEQLVAVDPDCFEGSPNPHLENLKQLIQDSRQGLVGLRSAAAAKPTGSSSITVQELSDRFLADETRRHELTREGGDAIPQEARLGASALGNTRSGLTTMNQQIGTGTASDRKQFGSDLMRYRRWLDKQFVDGVYQASTINDKLKTLGKFVRWCDENELVDAPKNLPKILKQYRPKPSAKALDNETIRKLWCNADETMKCWMAFGLNAGRYAAELATVRWGDLKDGYLAKRRGKTNVAYKIKLWPVTQQLIEMHRKSLPSVKPGDIVFVTGRGHPLVHEGTSGRTDNVGTAFRKLAKRLDVKATWSQLRDTSATRLEEMTHTGKLQADPSLVSLFLAHADDRTAKWYVDKRDPWSIRTDVLDEAVRLLGEDYDLKLQVDSDRDD